jgi:putative ABC transport system ATP-binding protein
MNSTNTISASNLCKSYGQGATKIGVLNDVSLQIEAGKLTLCVGPSGSGKSTLLAALSGLLPPDSGTVSLLDQDLWKLEEATRQRFRLAHCGFIFQGFNLFSALTAFEQVLLPLKYMRISTAEARDRSRAALDEVGLSARMHLLPAALSGGEKQRVAIARAMVKRPQFVFADEPTSALDSVNGQIVIRILSQMAHTHGATVLGVTHDPRLLEHADRVLHLEDGQLGADTHSSNSTI